MFFTMVNPMEDENRMEETCDLTKPRIVPFKKYLEPPSKYCILVQFETRSRERIAILPNTVACNRPLQHTTSCLHRESGMHEDEGGDITQGISIPKVATCCTEIKFANRCKRSA